MFRADTVVSNRRASTEDTRDWLILGLICVLSFITAICPVVRAFYHYQVDYKDGWMVYNVLAVVHHVPLYGTKYAWTMVNYPALSFYILAYLSRFSHDYLLTGRLMALGSFGICCVLIGLIIRKLTGRLAPALFGASFCIGLFFAAATGYMGLVDPQMLAEIFFLGGFLLYLSKPPTLGRIGLIVFLFVLGGNIKHNLLDFPLAVFIDLWLTSRRKAVQFLFFSAVLIATSIAVSIKVAGPFFIQNMLSVRPYSLLSALSDFFAYYAAIFLVFIAALLWSVKEWRCAPNRLISLLFFSSLLTGLFFAGGSGVAINIYFDNFFAMSIIVGMLIHSAWQVPSTFLGHQKFGRHGVPLMLLASLLLAFLFSGYSRFWSQVAEMPEEQRQFDAEVSFLKAQPGPALCESLLRCYYAGKPYVYDPYNGTRLVALHKLDSKEIVAAIESHHYGAIQLHAPVASLKRPNELFPDDVLDAISRYYVLSTQNQDCAIYVPETNSRKLAYGEVRLNSFGGNHLSE